MANSTLRLEESQEDTLRLLQGKLGCNSKNDTIQKIIEGYLPLLEKLEKTERLLYHTTQSRNEAINKLKAFLSAFEGLKSIA